MQAGIKFLLLLAVSFCCLSTTTARSEDVAFSAVNSNGVPGPLMICGGNSGDDIYDRFWELAGGYQARIVVVMTASPTADLAWGAPEMEARWQYPWAIRGVKNIKLVHAFTREDGEEPVLASAIENATAVWFSGGYQGRVTDRLLGSEFERRLMAFHRKGGLIGGTSAGAAVQSQVMIARGKDEPVLEAGFNLLPGAIIDQHFTARSRATRLKFAVRTHPERYGIGIDEATALLVRGREVEVIGQAGATLCLAPAGNLPEREIFLNTGDKRDIVAFQRAALARRQPPHVPSAAPALQKGSLVIVGGGGTPKETVARFIELAGGPDAKIVVLPTALSEPVPARDKITEVTMLERAGAKNVHVLAARDRQEVESESFAKSLREAQGVWFGGGRQWRFIDAYDDTSAEKLFQDVLTRGGVIGGSSAGASIQGEFLCRGNPLGNVDIHCEGYDRGLGFLPGTAIDQHFTQRNRLNDLVGLIKDRPQFLGIGIDESTALIVQGSEAEVQGKGKAFFVDGNRGEDGPKFTAVEPGKRFNLTARRVVEDVSEMAVGQ